MSYISIFDIVGPSMIGPSSSHTAGAVRLGLFARKIYGNEPKKVKFTLYNSFAQTGKGHGTDKGLVGGILGLNVEDEKIKNAFELAAESGLEFEFKKEVDHARHPNSVDIEFLDNQMLVSGNSLGAAKVSIVSIDGYKVDLRGDYPSLILVYKDQPGMISKVTKYIQNVNVNIATLDCARKERGREAFMSICLDSVLPVVAVEQIKQISSVYYLRSIDVLEK